MSSTVEVEPGSEETSVIQQPYRRVSPSKEGHGPYAGRRASKAATVSRDVRRAPMRTGS